MTPAAPDLSWIHVEPADPLGPAARQLAQEMVTEIPQRYGETFDAAGLAERADGVLAANRAFQGERRIFLVARMGEQLAGCGALQPLGPGMDDAVGEIKRMYVTQALRRRGIGTAILAALEEQARLFGYQRLRLETGDQQPEAVALYTAAGWVRIAPFGAYAGDPTSICLEKWL